MSWTELRINTTVEAIDWVSTLLASIDYQGDIHTAAYEADADADIGPDSSATESDWAFTVCLYFPEQSSNQSQINQQIDRIEALLSPLHRTGLTTPAEFAHVAEKPDSRDAALNQIHRVGQRFVIVPLHSSSGTDEMTAGDRFRTGNELILKLGNSLAFGSGLHPTTMLCLQLLERYVQPGMNTLDLGSGSGILSIGLAKLGAQVLAIDNDPVAVSATIAAVANNQVIDRVRVQAGSLGSGSTLGHWMGGEALINVPQIAPKREFDLIVSNLFARIQTSLADSFALSLRQTTPQTGILITAGYTQEYEEQIDAAMAAAGFEAIDRLQNDEWMALVHRLRD